MYNDIILNGLPITISGKNVEIFDPLHDVTHKEAAQIISYLHAEGFIRGSYAEYTVIRDDI